MLGLEGRDLDKSLKFDTELPIKVGDSLTQNYTFLIKAGFHNSTFPSQTLTVTVEITFITCENKTAIISQTEMFLKYDVALIPSTYKIDLSLFVTPEHPFCPIDSYAIRLTN